VTRGEPHHARRETPSPQGASYSKPTSALNTVETKPGTAELVGTTFFVDQRIAELKDVECLIAELIKNDLLLTVVL
jgi:hypothetical protein